MAKELPYYKFEPNQWENGNIQMCSREDKGLFIDLCSMYWSRLGDVPLKLAIQKLCGGNATAFDSLINEQIFLVIDGLICIDFLNEQLNEFENISVQNSKNAKEGWEKRRRNKESKRPHSDGDATALNPQSENDAIREEKIKVDDIKIEKETIAHAYDFLMINIPSQMEAFLMQNESQVKDFEKLINDYNDQVDIENLNYEPKILMARLKKWTRNWISNQDKYKTKDERKNATKRLSEELFRNGFHG